MSLMTDIESAPSLTPARARRGVLPVVCLALAAVVSAVASLNVAIPSMARETGASLTELSWIIDAYALTFAAFLLPGGAFGDRYGRRRALVWGLALFTLAATVACFLQEPTALIAVRAVLGAAAAMVMPATLSTITATFDEEARVKGIAVWAGVAGASAILGLLVAGAVLEVWEWPSVFAFSAVTGAISLVGAVAVVPESADPRHAARDPLGVVLSAAGLGVVVYSLIEAPTYGWSDARTLGGLAAGVVILGGFAAWEARTPRPLLAPRHFRSRAFAAGTLSLSLQFSCFFGFIFVFLQYLQLVRGQSPLEAALSMLPLPLGLLPAARLAPVLVPRLGQAPLCGAGLLMVGAALWSLSRAEADTVYWHLALALWPLGLGMGLAMPPATTAITEALPRAEQGVASAMNDLTREVGGALGIAVAASVAISTYRDQLVLPPGLPPAVVSAVRDSVGVAEAIGGPVAEAAHTAYNAGMADAFALSAAVVGCGAVVVVGLLLSGRRA